MATMHTPLSEIDLRISRLSVGEVVYPPGGRLGPRHQRDVQLVLVHDGSARIAVDGEEREPLRPGWTSLLLPGHREAFAFDDARPTRHAWIQVGCDAVPPAFAELPEALPTSPELAAVVEQAVAAAKAPPGPLLRALALVALWRYAADAESPPAGLVPRARAVIHDQLGDPGLDLDRLARAAHVSPAHLVRRFRAVLGTTPMAYLWERRVAVAVDLLQSTGLPIKEVASRTGFRSVYHFSRRVKAQAGVPPTEVRARQSSSSADASRSVDAPSLSVTRT
jgi:AraC-like DNA-binding protein